MVEQKTYCNGCGYEVSMGHYYPEKDQARPVGPARAQWEHEVAAAKTEVAGQVAGINVLCKSVNAVHNSGMTCYWIYFEVLQSQKVHRSTAPDQFYFCMTECGFVPGNTYNVVFAAKPQADPTL